MADALAIVFGVLFVPAAVAAVWLFAGRSRLALDAARAGQEAAHSREALERVELEKRQALERADDLAAQLSQANQRLAALESRREAEEQAHVQRLADLNAARQQFADTFKAISADILKEQNARAAEHFEQRRQAIEQMVKPMRESLERYEKTLTAIEKDRAESHSRLHAQIEHMKQTGETLRRETSQLTLALKGSETRGRWGEFQLRRIVELAGMTEHVDFIEQPQVDGPEGRLRPDMIVKLPERRQIIVDSKAVIDAYIRAMSTEDEGERRAHLERHARHVREQVNLLGSKAYAKAVVGQEEHTPEFVVMFLPGEAHLCEAARIDPDLFDEAVRKGVIIVTPMTLIALLKAIAYGWRQERLAEEAKAILSMGMEMHSRLCSLIESASGVGVHLDRAVKAYNSFIDTIESKAASQARKFEDFGIKSRLDIREPKPIESRPRETRRLAGETEGVEA